ncbi:hypothetical protein CLV92_11795 [Kineococcus xinjiangensis]|uniref:Subtilisin inhibitor-like n=1 Tax=Kineococcus xinjiangensis TaxID=512762 RepID=A0A2S6ID53_9ACTN|nr:hypothetical protein [Kineococcus xinjiangensis]PPK92127.1 hypothetical protein CLV92_11795 [Kineococcus xinjiangensis]
MRRLRPALAACLAVVAVGGVAAVTVPRVQEHVDNQNLQQAVAAARAIPTPAGAADSPICRDDLLVACWEVDKPFQQIATSLADALSDQAGQPVDQECRPEPPAAGQAVESAREGRGQCSLKVSFGDRGVNLVISSLTAANSKVITDVGTLVSVTPY